MMANSNASESDRKAVSSSRAVSKLNPAAKAASGKSIPNRGEIKMSIVVPPSGIEEVRAHSTWFLCLGVALIIIGTLAIGSAELMTMVSVMLLGWLLIFGGLFEVI